MKLIIWILLSSILAPTLLTGAINPDSLKLRLSDRLTPLERHSTLMAIADYYDQSQMNSDSIAHYSSTFPDFVKTNKNHPLVAMTKYHIASGLYNADTTKFFKAIRSTMEYAEEHGDFEAYGRSVFLAGAKYRMLSQFEDSRKILQQGLNIFENRNSSRDLHFKARFCSLISGTYHQQSKLLESVTYGLKAQEYAIQAGDDNLLLRSYFNLSGAYGDLASEEKKIVSPEDRQRYKKLALENMQKAYEHCQKGEMNRSKGISAYNLGVLYSIEDDYALSNKYLTEAIDIAKALPYYELLFNCYDVLGEDLLEANKPDSAYYFITLADSIATKLNSPFHSISSGLNFAFYYMTTGDYSKARKISVENTHLAEAKEILGKAQTGYELLYDIESKAGNFREALNYYIKKDALKDSIAGSEHIQQIDELNARYEHVKQKAEIESLTKAQAIKSLQLTQKNRLIIFSILGGLFLSSIIFLYFRHRSLQAEKQSLYSKQKLLRSQLNPHFLFNALNAIQQYIYLKKDPTLVADYLAKFSQLTRRILQYSQEDFITLAEEIEFLKDYLDLQQLRFDIPFEYRIEIDPSIDPEELKIPPMFSQPFIENSIEHGILNKSAQGKILLSVNQVNNQLEIILEDNGIGISRTSFKNKNTKHRSLAINITKERIKLLGSKLRRQTGLIITDLSEGNDTITGTKVVLKLPILY